jgi:large subunit ribosomal protein L16
MAKLSPARTKYRKEQKNPYKGNAKGNDFLAFGDFGIQALEDNHDKRKFPDYRITAAQIEAARVAITGHLKRKGKVWVRVFPQKPITKKPAETRMGKGKGGVEYWVAVARPGTILFEIAGVPESLAREAMSLADAKLSLYCRFITRNN